MESKVYKSINRVRKLTDASPNQRRAGKKMGVGLLHVAHVYSEARDAAITRLCNKVYPFGPPGQPARERERKRGIYRRVPSCADVLSGHSRTHSHFLFSWTSA